MKVINKFLLLGIGVLLIGRVANAAEEKSNTQVSSFKDFQHVVIQGTWNAKIIYGSQYQIQVSAVKLDPTLFKVTQNNDTITISNTKSEYPNRFKVTVVLPKLTSLELRGTDDTEVSGFNVKDLFFSIEGTQSLIGTNNQIENLKLYAAGTTAIDFRNSKTTNVNLQILGTNTTKLNMQGGDLIGQAKGVVSIAYWGTVRTKNVTPGEMVKIEQQ